MKAPHSAIPDDGGSAFPFGQSQGIQPTYGMSQRDYFAAHAPAMTEQWFKDSQGDGIHWLDAHAAWSYAYADAMIRARKV